ncbi:MAG: hypothetical protein IKB16_06925 [Lentisphaeria bacterium]|nr:hypothetical protein [Lentisphaeria bacterium]
MKQVLLIDAYAWIYRSYYAIRLLTNSQGQPTNAIFAMLRFLLKLEDEYPDFDGVFVFDCGKPKHRLELAPQYKANRPPMPDELKQQTGIIRDLICDFGWQIIEQENWEADDLIGCLVNTFQNRDFRIVSGDKDLSQLIQSPRVEMLIPSQDGKTLQKRGDAETIEKFGVPPCAIRDYLALIGDTSDNIPGIEGIGPKTAAQLLQQFGSIDAMLSAPDQIKRETLRTKITGNCEKLTINRQLVSLLTEPEPGMTLTEEQFLRKAPDYAKILKTAENLELRSTYKDLQKRCSTSIKADEKAGEWEQGELF